MLDWLKRRRHDGGLTAIDLQADSISVARIDRSGAERPRLTACEVHNLDNTDETKLLGQFAAHYHLNHACCTTLLSAGDYQLLLTEAPDVNPDELKSALRWRVKDLIDFHINDAVLDVFDLPGAAPAPGAKAREMYAVAARSETIQKRVDLLTTAGIGLEIIDIPELAQRNLAALLPEDAAGVALLSFKSDSGLITITRQGYLYLSRALNLGVDTLHTADDPVRYFDHIVLEVQRSLDYFESHFREAPVRHLVLAPFAKPVPGLLEHLRDNLGITVGAMDLAQLLDSDVELTPDLQARCLTTIGAALRHEEKAL